MPYWLRKYLAMCFGFFLIRCASGINLDFAHFSTLISCKLLMQKLDCRYGNIHFWSHLIDPCTWQSQCLIFQDTAIHALNLWILDVSNIIAEQRGIFSPAEYGQWYSVNLQCHEKLEAALTSYVFQQVYYLPAQTRALVWDELQDMGETEIMGLGVTVSVVITGENQCSNSVSKQHLKEIMFLTG